MSQSEKTVANVLDNGLVRITSVIGFIVFVSVASWNVAAWFTLIEAKLIKIEAEIILGTQDRFRRAEMYRFCRETELLNPGWKCGQLEE